MLVMLNGRLLAEEAAKVSIFDRGFLLGDGLFETMRVFRGRPFRWADHLDRLRRGAEFLMIKIPFSESELREQARQLIEANQMPESVLRLTLTRGVGLRGYLPRGADHPTLTMTLHPAPDTTGKPLVQWRAITSSYRLPAGEKLAQFKTCNKLPQILARAEADARGANEALMLNTDGEVVEGAGSNLFWLRDGVVGTPPLAAGILAGVTRALVLDICRSLSVPVREEGITPAQLCAVDGVFLSLSTWGIVEVISLDGSVLKRSAMITQLRQAYEDAIQAGVD